MFITKHIFIYIQLGIVLIRTCCTNTELRNGKDNTFMVSKVKKKSLYFSPYYHYSPFAKTQLCPVFLGYDKIIENGKKGKCSDCDDTTGQFWHWTLDFPENILSIPCRMPLAFPVLAWFFSTYKMLKCFAIHLHIYYIIGQYF